MDSVSIIVTKGLNIAKESGIFCVAASQYLHTVRVAVSQSMNTPRKPRVCVREEPSVPTLRAGCTTFSSVDGTDTNPQSDQRQLFRCLYMYGQTDQ